MSFTSSSSVFVTGLFGLSAVCGQVMKEVRPQPFPLTIDSIAQCCQHIDSPLELAKCSNSSKSMARSAADVALVAYLAPEKGSSFDIPDIMTFGSYMLANTAAYAEHNDYSFHWMSEETGSNYQPGDARWNKVKIIDVALDPENGWAKDSSYIVWLDADAIVLDLGLSIEKIGEQYPSADFIASADIRQGYLNSGFLMMRNTPWLRNFVRQWWDVVDRSEKCDQDAFDVLYEKYLADYTSGKTEIGDVRKKVAILDRDALNSDPPAMTHQKDYNQVIHLMGEITPQRREAFYKGLSSVCTAAASPASPSLPNQLGVTRDFLLATASDVYSKHVNDLMESAQKPEASVKEFDALSVACHHLTDIYTTIGDDASWEKYQALYANVYDITMKWLKDFQESHQNPAEMTSDLAVTYLYMLKRTAENGNDYFHSLNTATQKKMVANQVLIVLDQLYEQLHEQSKPFARHMSALMYHNLGDMMYNMFLELEQQSPNNKDSAGVLAEGLEYEKKSVEFLKRFYDRTDNKSIMREYIQSLQLTAIYYCTLADFEEAEKYWVPGISKAEGLAAGVTIGNHFANLRPLYYNAAVCNFRGGQYALALERLERMMQVYETIGGLQNTEHPPDVQHASALLKELEKMIAANPDLLNKKKPTASVGGDDEEEEWEECAEGEEGCEEVEVFVDENGNIVPVGTRVITEDDLDEWEECSVGDPDCEEVEIIEGDDDEEDDEDEELAEIRAQYAAQSKRFNVDTTTANSGSQQQQDDEEEDDDEDEDDEDEKELAEIRAQYAAQSKRFNK